MHLTKTFYMTLQENIRAFGGDDNNVTVMGHGKGAMYVNFLMISNAVPTGKFSLKLSFPLLCP